MFPPDLPCVKNWPLYIYRIFAKWLSFFVFGLISIILVILVVPPMRLFIHPHGKFIASIRRFVSASMRLFFNFMHLLKIVDVDVDDRDLYRQLSSKIIVANHPSLLDPVLIISLIPKADTIAAEHLRRSIISGVVRQLYILNSDDHNKIINSCDETLKNGNCLLIFPEGTRTVRSKEMRIKKGAARIAIASGCGIVPVHIGGTDKFGLGKKDPWFGFNPTERYVYKVRMGKEINPEQYKNMPHSAAVQALTKEILRALS